MLFIVGMNLKIDWFAFLGIHYLRKIVFRKRNIVIFFQLVAPMQGLSILYVLLKVHKTNCPVKPILAALGTYTYKIVKFLVPLLQPLTINQFTVLLFC